MNTRRNNTATRPIQQSDVGKRSDGLHLALVFCPRTRQYFYTEGK